MDTFLEGIHPDLQEARESAYKPSGLTIENFLIEPESKEYGACVFEMNNLCIKFRVAKKTPIKTGQFVTLWKREGVGSILPHDIEDPIDLFVIGVCNSDNFGQFVFPKTVLSDRGIVSKERRGGKRAMRIYAPWDFPVSPQAKKAQAWQLQYFFGIPLDKGVDIGRIRELFN